MPSDIKIEDLVKAYSLFIEKSNIEPRSIAVSKNTVIKYFGGEDTWKLIEDGEITDMDQLIGHIDKNKWFSDRGLL